MPDPIQSVAGCKFFIGGEMDSQTTDLVAADFSGEVWTEVGFLEDLGEVGDASSSVTFSAIGEDRVFKLKGTRDAGTQELVMASRPTDAGQVALVAAEATRANYAIKLEWNDGVSVPTRRLYIGMIMSIRERYTTSDNVIRMVVTVGVNSNVVRTAAV